MREGSDAAAALGEVVREQLGVNVVASQPLPAGLGPRRFVRLILDGPPGRLVARIDADEDPAGRPSAAAPEPALEPLRSFLEDAGLPVPARHGGDWARGVELLEDLGERTLERAAAEASSEERRALYAQACALVPRLQALSDPGGEIPAFGRRLDGALFAYKAGLFSRFSLPLALGRDPRRSEIQAVERAFLWIAERCQEAPARLAHRDFQSQNLLLRAESGGSPQIIMIDLQGAFLAPPEYDLVCLLRDSYAELPDEEVREHLERVRPSLPDAPDPETFARRFDLLTLTRKGKDHARFVHASQRRDDPRYLVHLPATVRALRAAAPRCAGLDPCLVPLCAWIEALPLETPPCAP